MARIVMNEAVLESLAAAAVEKAADGVAERANAVPSTTSPAATEPYYEAHEDNQHEGQFVVWTANPRAMRHEAKTDALLRALDNG